MQKIFPNHFFKIILVLFFISPVFVSAASVSIQSVSQSTNINPGNAVYFTAVPADFNGSTTFTVSDSVGSSISSSNINSTGVFAWIPLSSDGGVHNITVTVTDGSGNTATAYQQLTVLGTAGVTIQNLYPGSSVNVGQTVFFNAIPSNLSNPMFSASDSVASSITSNNMNSSGGFSWTPREQDIGGHSITVNAYDNTGRTASVTQSITVAMATATIQSLSPGESVVAKQTVTFTVSPTGFTNPTYTISDSVSGSSVGTISSNGAFSWTPQTSNLGTHILTITVSDSTGNNVSISQKIIVASASLNISAISPGKTISAGTSLSFIATSTGLNTPSYSLSDTFSGGTLSSTNINSTGAFAWIPTGIDAGVHNITVRAFDNNGNNATSQLTIIVTGSTNTQTTTQTNTGTTGTVKYTFNNLLSVGSTGAEVTELQKILISKGYLSGTPTGYYGTLTANAVKLLQSANGLSPLGYVGPGTRTVLNTGTTASTGTTVPTITGSGFVFTKALTLGSSGTEVTELQKKLTSLGIYSGPITGTFGPLTQTAVKKFQATYGLDQVGHVGPGTRAKLNSI